MLFDLAILKGVAFFVELLLCQIKNPGVNRDSCISCKAITL